MKETLVASYCLLLAYAGAGFWKQQAAKQQSSKAAKQQSSKAAVPPA
ncbi:MAG TPA: hypothetical protein VIK50_07745 [Gemmatimonadaceae bacterium]